MNDRIHLLLAHFVLTHLAVSIKSVNLTKSLDFSGPTTPHKTIETNKKKPSPASVLSLGHIWASTLTWGRRESILKESE